MEQIKLIIQVEDAQGVFPLHNVVVAHFNPNQVTFQKSNNWIGLAKAGSDTRQESFGSGEPLTLSLDLMFDTYTYGHSVDVRLFTRKIYHLTTVEKHGNLHRPPLCRIVWGLFNISSEYNCEWLLQSLTQRFTLFLANGTPVRAVLSCGFRQWRGNELEAKLADKQSTDVAKTRVVRRGDTLSSIAAEELEDPAQWRAIAIANNIDDPRCLDKWIGQRLKIPTLRDGQPARR